jgi:phenylalanyl-tRNA synthetase alpha chain
VKEKAMVELRENEYKTLLTIEKLGGKASLEQIMKESGLPDATIMRAALTLQEKKLVRIQEEKQIAVNLNEEGKAYANKGLPERGTLNVLIERHEIPISDIPQQVDLPQSAIPVTLGWLVRKGWAIIDTEKNTIRAKSSTPQPLGNDEELLKHLKEKEWTVAEDLSSELLPAVKILKRRKLLEVDEKTKRIIEITETGWKRIKKGIRVSAEVTQLTPELIITGKWREAELTKFDVTAPGPAVYPAKTHPVQQIIQRTKEIFAEMGFTEIRGPIVETAFWNFDALFQPQDHPAREMHDTFYLKYPKTGKLPKKSVVNKVAKTHENGWKTGSRGWQYSWSPEEAKKLVFRTHTTATTIRYLAEHKEPPVKVFSVDRVYRNEKMGYKNLAEFHQIEGIIMDKNVTLRDLIGTLKEFYLRLGLEKVRFWPSYFPYTEPSAQSTVYIPEFKKWFELCGMGIFRPEVLAPLGIGYPVLAWGGGLERLIMLKLGLDDIRFLYKNDLGWIRRIPTCQ